MPYSNPNTIGFSTLFTWTIKNFELCPHQTSQVVISPEFSHFAQQMAEFYIELYPRGVETSGADYMSVYLAKITSSKTECDTDYYREMGIMTTKGKLPRIRSNGPFQQGTSKGSPNFLNRSLSPTDGDLTLYCAIFTEESTDSRRQMTFPDAELLELSESFGKVYEEELFTDMTLKTNREKLKVHRAMIEVRLPDLEKQSGGGLANMEHKTADTLLRYTYTGKLNMENSQFLDLVSSPDMSSHMKSLLGMRWREIKAETIITRKRVSFRWEVKHFRTLTADDVVMYSMSDNDIQKWTWLDFTLSVSSNEPSDVSDVLFSVTRYSRECKRIVCRIAALDRCKTFEHTFGEEDCWKIPAFARRGEVVDKGSDVASFLFEISLTDGKSTASVNSVELCQYSSASSDISDNLKSLRDDLGTMLNRCTHNDVVLTVAGQRFPCHRFVLAARSRGFRKIFERNKIPHQVLITDVEPGSVKSMLRYLYMGRIDDFPDLKQILDLFELANRYNIPSLKKESVRRIKSSQSADTLGEVLLAADKWNDAELKGCVLDFVCTVPKLVLESSRLQQILKSKNDLAVEIMNRALTSLVEGYNGSKEIEKPD